MIDAMKQALQALEHNNRDWQILANSGDAGWWKAEEQEGYRKSEQAIESLRAAIAAAERAEPVAYVNNDGFIIEVDDIGIVEGTKLYAHPPAITDEMVERATIAYENAMRAEYGRPLIAQLDGIRYAEQGRNYARAALEAALGAKHAE